VEHAVSLRSRQAGPEPAARWRIDPFVLPTATTGRSLLLLIAVLGTSLFTYDFMYLAFGTVSGGHEDTVWMVAGVVAVLLVTAAAYIGMPTWIIQRRRLGPLTAEDSPELHEEMAQLASEAGLPRAPMLMVDAVNPSVSALVFGLPRRRRLRLNAGLVTLFYTDVAGFRATVRHELAHLRNRDLDQTFLVIASWYAFLIIVLVPLVLTMLLQPAWPGGRLR
jgi:Zn-dependent protease with chaperone function